MLDFLKQKACDLGASSYCPPVEEVCKGIFECYVKPHLTSIAAIAGGTAVIAGGVAAYMKKDAILGKSEKADDVVSHVKIEKADDVVSSAQDEQVTAPRRSARLASKQN